MVREVTFLSEALQKTESFVLLEKLRSSGKFDFQAWKNLPPEQQFQELQANFQALGEGSSRKAFTLSSRFALKYAINSKGIGQNQTEVKFALNKEMQPAVALVQDYAQNGQWVMSQLVRALKSWSEFESIKGYPNSVLGLAMEHQWEPEDIASAPGITPDQVKAAQNDLAFLNAVSGLVRAGLVPGDMKFHDHWGKTPDNRIVLLDYGFDKNVANKEYGFLGGAGSDDVTRKPQKRT